MNRPKVNFSPEKWVKLTELKPHPKNPRIDLRQDAARFDELKNSIEEGVFEPIKISKTTGYCLAGNQRLKAFADLGYEEVPVMYNECADEKEEITIMIKDNNEAGAYNYTDLDQLIKEFDLASVALMLNEFDMKGLASAEKKAKRDLKEDDVPSAPEIPKAKMGDIYQLGEHRLMCGDSTKVADVQLLMNGHKADMVFTDPPYNINYSGAGKKTSNTIENNNMSREDFRTFLEKIFIAYQSAVKTSAPFYVCHSFSSQRDFEDAMESVGLRARNQIIWNKTLASMGWGNYRWKHEPIFYATFAGETPEFYGDRCQYTVWNESWAPEKLIENIKKLCERQEKGGSTIWTLSRDQNYVHPTQKPIQLLEIAIENSSKKEDLVLDLFGGSGSTLIGAEKCGRRAYIMELDPKYVDVIIQRWEEYTDQKATKL